MGCDSDSKCSGPDTSGGNSTDSKRERKVCVYFGDSLGCKAPKELLKTTKAYLQAIFEDVEWVTSTENYTLDVLKHEKQEDGFSCGMYVISAAANFSLTHGIMPDTRLTEYIVAMSEKVRMCCVTALLSSVLHAIDNLKNPSLSDPNAVHGRYQSSAFD